MILKDSPTIHWSVIEHDHTHTYSSCILSAEYHYWPTYRHRQKARELELGLVGQEGGTVPDKDKREGECSRGERRDEQQSEDGDKQGKHFKSGSWIKAAQADMFASEGRCNHSVTSLCQLSVWANTPILEWLSTAIPHNSRSRSWLDHNTLMAPLRPWEWLHETLSLSFAACLHWLIIELCMSRWLCTCFSLPAITNCTHASQGARRVPKLHWTKATESSETHCVV